MISLSDINPLDWHGLKFINGEIPVHFTIVPIFDSNDSTRILDWLVNNATGRYAFKEVYDNDNKNWFTFPKFEIGFENQIDATFFVMDFE